MPRPRPRISFPHSSQVTYHASKQWKPHAPATANPNQHTRSWPAGTRLTLLSFAQLFVPQSLRQRSVDSVLSLMCCVCYFPYVQFGLFFSRSNTCPAMVISNPHLLCVISNLFFLLSFTISSHGITTQGHVSFLFLFSHLSLLLIRVVAFFSLC